MPDIIAEVKAGHFTDEVFFVLNSKIAIQGKLKTLKIKPYEKTFLIGNHATTLNVFLFRISFFSRIQNKNQKSNWNAWSHIKEMYSWTLMVHGYL
jgi:hypothetical protein